MTTSVSSLVRVATQPTAQPYFGARPASDLQAGRLHLMGICFDGAASFRKGAEHGPDAIRQVSPELESYSPLLDMDLEDIAPFFDLGNLVPGQDEGPDQVIERLQAELASVLTTQQLCTEGCRFLTLGGDHAISYPLIQAYLAAFSDLVVVHLDAHADLRDGYLGVHFSHAAVIRRCLDQFGPHHQLAQFGIRSGTKEEFAWMRQANSLYSDLDFFCNWLTLLPAQRPIYLTLDLDFFDPSLLAGTGTPEAGGEDFRSFQRIVSILAQKNLVGADVVELAPELDASGNSAICAAKVVRELILAMHHEVNHD